MLRRYAVFAILTLHFIACTTVRTAKPASTRRLPSKDHFRAADLFSLSPGNQVLYYQNAEQILLTRKIKAGTKKYPLVEAQQDLSNIIFSYRDTLRTLDAFMRETKAVGLIIIRNDSVLYEKYREGTGPQTKWINFSVAKSVTSLLYGAALQDGYIKSLDQKVTQFIPELTGSAYDSVSLRTLLQMSSGVGWNDDPRKAESDLMKIGRLEKEKGWEGIVEYLFTLKRVAPPGEQFNYNTVETGLAALILKKVIKKPLAEYLSEKIWKPFGMHEDGNWVLNQSLDTEIGGCCISATLRDYALLGIFTMNNGVTLNGTNVLPTGWMQASTTPAKSSKEYGYYWWLRPNRRYYASGAFGQQVEVDPLQKTVIAVQSYWPVAFNNYYVGYLDTAVEALMSALRIKK